MKQVLILIIVLVPAVVLAQDDLLRDLEQEATNQPDYVTATFKGSRLINLHTVETLSKGSLDFRISHRFANVNTGAAGLWGLDGPAAIRLGFDYSLTNHFVLGIGRTSVNNYFDGFVKYKLLRQTSSGGSPLTLTTLGSVNVYGDKDALTPITGIDRYAHFSSRLAYTAQVLIARKFNSRFSLQLSPIYIHYNLVTRANDKNDLVAVALSGRYKFTSRTALTFEYSTVPVRYAPDDQQYKDVFSVGVDIETGGHVFQLFLSNAYTINEVQWIPFNTNDWFQRQFRIGFNVSRVFQVGKAR